MILMLFHIDGNPMSRYISRDSMVITVTVIWNKISSIDITQAKKHRCKSLCTAYPPAYLSVCRSIYPSTHLSI